MYTFAPIAVEFVEIRFELIFIYKDFRMLRNLYIVSTNKIYIRFPDSFFLEDSSRESNLLILEPVVEAALSSLL
jgi:hypothetical protein